MQMEIPMKRYDEKREFNKHSKLHRYLAYRYPGSITLEEYNYQVCEIVLTVTHIIIEDKLYDPENPTIILCDIILEDAIDIHAFHITSLKRVITRQFTKTPDDPTGPHNVDGGMFDLHITSPATNNETYALPSWANPNAKAVRARVDNIKRPFDTRGSYYVSPKLLTVFKTIRDISPNQIIFEYKEITAMLTTYIMENKTRLFNPKNHLIAMVKDDLLGEVFGVLAFHRNQAIGLLRQQLKPFNYTLFGETLIGQNTYNDPIRPQNRT